MNCKFHIRPRVHVNASDEAHGRYNNEQQLIPIRSIEPRCIGNAC